MGSKRSATSDINHENWDAEEKPEEAGTFQVASQKDLNNRIIKTARRRNPISSVRVSLVSTSLEKIMLKSLLVKWLFVKNNYLLY